MIKEIAAARLDDGTILCSHTIEVYCPNCSRDVDEAELADKKCNDCGFDLSTPKQHISIHATSVPAAGSGVM